MARKTEKGGKFRNVHFRTPYAVLMSDAGRLAVQAMAEKDERTLNNLLVQHIKNERKWPVGYSIFVDAYSIAYIKLARLNNMNCGLDVIEVPKMFFDDAACKIDISEIKLPFLMMLWNSSKN